MEERKVIKKIIMLMLAAMLIVSSATNVFAAAKPKAPVPKATVVNGTTVKLSWKKVKGVGGYYIFRSTKKTSGFKKIASPKKTATSYTDKKGLKAGTTYYYRMQSWKKVKKKTLKSANSKVVSAKPVTKVTKVTISGSKTVLLGKTTALKATLTPSNATYKTIAWTSSDESVATVDATGVVTGLKLGKATITATATTDKKSATFEITVAPIKVENVTVEGEKSINVGETTKLNAIIAPLDATEPTITWESDAPDVVKIDAEGNVTGLKRGTALITATAKSVEQEEGIVSKRFRFDVNQIDVESIDIGGDIDVAVGEEKTLTATIMPENASNKNVTWTSDNPDVATIDENGKITGVKYGYATITASIGKDKAEIKVNVTDPLVTSVSTLKQLNDVIANGNAQVVDIKEDIEIYNPIEIDKPVTITSAYDKTITLDSSAPCAFIVNANDVKFDGVNFVGEKDGKAGDEVQSIIKTAASISKAAAPTEGLTIENSEFKYSGVAVNVPYGNVNVNNSAFDRQRLYGVKIDKTDSNVDITENTFTNIANDSLWKYPGTDLNAQLGAVNVEVLNKDDNTINVSNNEFTNIGLNTSANDMVVDNAVPSVKYDGEYMADSAPITVSRYDANVTDDPIVTTEDNSVDTARVSTVLNYNAPKNKTAVYCTDVTNGFTTFGFTGAPSIEINAAQAASGKTMAITVPYEIDEAVVTDNDGVEVKVERLGAYDEATKTQEIVLGEPLDVEKKYTVSISKTGYKDGNDNSQNNITYTGIQVDTTGATPNAPTTIADAIAMAQAGDTVVLPAGTYNGDINVDKDLTLYAGTVQTSSLLRLFSSRNSGVTINGKITSSANLEIRYPEITNTNAPAINVTEADKTLKLKATNVSSDNNVIVLAGNADVLTVDEDTVLTGNFVNNANATDANRKFVIRANGKKAEVNLANKANIVNNDTAKTYSIYLGEGSNVNIAGKAYSLPEYEFVVKASGRDLNGETVALNLDAKNKEDFDTQFDVISCKWRMEYTTSDGATHSEVIGTTKKNVDANPAQISSENHKAGAAYLIELDYTDTDNLIKAYKGAEDSIPFEFDKDKLPLTFGENGNITIKDKNTVEVASDIIDMTFKWNDKAVSDENTAYDSDTKKYTITVDDIVPGEENTMVANAPGFTETTVEKIVWIQDAPEFSDVTLDQSKITEKSNAFKNSFYNQFAANETDAAQAKFDESQDGWFFDIVGANMTQDFIDNVESIKFGEQELLGKTTKLSIGNSVKIQVPLAKVDTNGLRISQLIAMLETPNENHELVFTIQAKNYKDVAAKLIMPEFTAVSGNVLVNKNGTTNDNGKYVDVTGNDADGYNITPKKFVDKAEWWDDYEVGQGVVMTYFDLQQNGASVLNSNSFVFTKKINSRTNEIEYGSTAVDLLNGTPYVARYLSVYMNEEYDDSYTIATTDLYGPQTFNLHLGKNVEKDPAFEEISLTADDITSKSEDFANTFYNKYNLTDKEQAQNDFNAYENWFVDVKGTDISKTFIDNVESIKLGEQELYNKENNSFTRISIGKDVHLNVPLAKVDENGLHIATPVMMLDTPKNDKLTFTIKAKDFDAIDVAVNMPQRNDLNEDVFVNPNGEADNNGKNVVITKEDASNYSISAKRYLTPASWWGAEDKASKGVLMTFMDLLDNDNNSILNANSFVFTKKVDSSTGDVTYGSTGMDTYSDGTTQKECLAAYLKVYNDKSYTYNYTVATTNLYGPKTFNFNIGQNAKQDAGFETLVLDTKTIEDTSKAFKASFYNKYNLENKEQAQIDFDNTKNEKWFYSIPVSNLDEAFLNGIDSIKLNGQELFAKTAEISIGMDVKVKAPLAEMNADKSALNVALPIVMLEETNKDNQLEFTVKAGEQSQSALIKMPVKKEMNGDVFVNPNGEKDDNGKYIDIEKNDDTFTITPNAHITPASWKPTSTDGIIMTYFDLTDKDGNKVLTNDSFMFTKKIGKNGNVSYGSTGVDSYENNPYLALYLYIYNDKYDYTYTVSTTDMYGPKTFNLNVGRNIAEGIEFRALTLNKDEIVEKGSEFSAKYFNKYQNGQDANAQEEFDKAENSKLYYFDVEADNLTQEFVNNVTSIKLGNSELYNKTTKLSIGNNVKIEVPLAQINTNGLKVSLPIVMLEKGENNKLTFKVTSNGTEYDAVINVPEFDGDVTDEVVVNHQDVKLEGSNTQYTVTPEKYIEPTNWSEGRGVIPTYFNLKKGNDSIFTNNSIVFTKKVKTKDGEESVEYGSTGMDKLNGENRVLLYLYTYGDSNYNYDYTVATPDRYGPTEFNLTVGKNPEKAVEFTTLDLSKDNAIVNKSTEFSNKFYNKYSKGQDNDAQNAFDADSSSWYFKIEGANITKEYLDNITSVELKDNAINKETVNLSIGNDVKLNTKLYEVKEDGLYISLPIVMLEQPTDNKLTFTINSTGFDAKTATIIVPSFTPANGSVYADYKNGEAKDVIANESGVYDLTSTKYIPVPSWSDISKISAYIDLEDNGNSILNNDTFVFSKKVIDNVVTYGATGTDKLNGANKILLYVTSKDDSAYDYDYTVATADRYGPTEFKFNVGKNPAKEAKFTETELTAQDIKAKGEGFKENFYDKYENTTDGTAAAQSDFTNGKGEWKNEDFYFDINGEDLDLLGEVTSVKLGETELMKENTLTIGKNVKIKADFAKVDEKGLHIALPIVMLEQPTDGKLTFKVQTAEKTYDAVATVPAFTATGKKVNVNYNNGEEEEITAGENGKYTITPKKYVPAPSWTSDSMINTYVELTDGSNNSLFNASSVVYTKKVDSDKNTLIYGMTGMDNLDGRSVLLMYLRTYLESQKETGYAGYDYDYTIATPERYGPTLINFHVDKNVEIDEKEELKNAIADAKDGETVQVDSDIVLADGEVITIDKDITLNVTGNITSENGTVFDIKGNAAIEGSGTISGKDAVKIGENAEVTINGVTIEGTEHSVYNENGTVTLESGNLVGQALNKNGEFTIWGGTVTNEGDVAVKNESGTAEINDGAIIGQALNESGELNIYGGSITNEGKTAVKNDKGVVTMNGGEVKGSCGILVIGQGGENDAGVVMNAGKITATSIGIATNGKTNQWGGNVVISGQSVIESDYVGIYFPGKGTLTIMGGTITAKKEAGIEIRNGVLDMQGGSVECLNTAETTCNKNSNGSTTVSAGIAVVPHVNATEVTANISGGIVKGYTPVFSKDVEEKGATIYVNVTGGNYNKEIPSEYLNGYKCVLNEETGLYDIVEKVAGFTETELTAQDIKAKGEGFKENFYDKYENTTDGTAAAQSDFTNGKGEWKNEDFYFDINGEDLDLLGEVTSVKLGEVELMKENTLTIGKNVKIKADFAKVDEKGLHIALPIVMLEQPTDGKLTFKVQTAEKTYDAVATVPAFTATGKKVNVNYNNGQQEEITEADGKYTITPKKYVPAPSWTSDSMINTYVELTDGSNNSLFNASSVVYTKKVDSDKNTLIYGMTGMDNLDGRSVLLMYLRTYLEDQKETGYAGYDYDYTIATPERYGPTLINFHVDKNVEKEITSDNIQENITNAPNGATIDLNNDIILTDGQSLEIEQGKSLTIDLGNNDITSSDNLALDVYGDLTITGSGTISSSSASVAAWINNGGKLTLNGATIKSTKEGQYALFNDGGKLEIKNGSVVDSQSTGIYNSGDITINDATVKSANENAVYSDTGVVTVNEGANIDGVNGIFAVGNNSTVDINGGNITSKLIGVTTNGNKENWGTTLNIKGGRIVSESLGVYLPSDGTLTISDGAYIEGAQCGVEVRNGSLDMTGGTVISTTGASTTCIKNSSGSTTTGAGIAVVPHVNATSLSATISGGTVKGVTSVYANDIQETGIALNVSISGGSFSTDVTSFVDATLYQVVENSGMFEVSDKVSGVDNLQNSINDAEEGAQIEIDENLTLEENQKLTVDKDLTIDLGDSNI